MCECSILIGPAKDSWRPQCLIFFPGFLMSGIPTEPAAGQNVTPWDVKGEVVDGKVQAIDYNKLVKQFGTKLIDQGLLDRFEKLTGHKPHHFLRRGIFFSHRELDKILDLYEKGKSFYRNILITSLYWKRTFFRIDACWTYGPIPFLQMATGCV